jgi:hypothetical protein
MVIVTGYLRGLNVSQSTNGRNSALPAEWGFEILLPDKTWSSALLGSLREAWPQSLL